MTVRRALGGAPRMGGHLLLRSLRPLVCATPTLLGTRRSLAVEDGQVQGPLLSLRCYVFSCDSEGLAAGPSAVPLQQVSPGWGGEGVATPGSGLSAWTSRTGVGLSL